MMKRVKSARSNRSAIAFVVAIPVAFALGGIAWAQSNFSFLPDTSAFGSHSLLTSAFGMSSWQRILMISLSSLCGFLIGLFLCPATEAFRRFVIRALAALGLAYAIFGDMLFADGLSCIYSTVLFFVALAIAIKIGQSEEAIAKSRPTSFGSARWATYEHLKNSSALSRSGLILGEFPGRHDEQVDPIIRYKGDRHLLTVAPTRSGKGVSSIIPNLLTYPGSVLVVDPKGENALVTALRRGPGCRRPEIPGMNQDLFLLDPWNIAAGKLGLRPSCFNPLDWIRPDDPDAAENAFLLADAIVVSEAKDEGRFWEEEAKALLMGLILYVATAKEEAKNRTLGRVRDLLTLDDAEFQAVLTKMFKSPNPVIRSTAARQASKDTKLFSSVLATVQSHTHFLDSPRIRASLERSDFRFEDMKLKPTTIYLILPADRLKTFDRWLRLLIQHAITVNARNIEQKPRKSILFMLDEMASLGHLPAVEQAYGLMAGYGMQLWGIVQDLSQLAKIYGTNGWQTFISNSGVIQYFGSRDQITAEYFSSLCGVTTIETHSISNAISRAFSISSGPGGGSSSSSDSWTRTNGASEAQRKLAYPDELMVLKGSQQIVFIENLNPILAQKFVWYESGIKKWGVNLHVKDTEQDKAPDPKAVCVAEDCPRRELRREYVSATPS